MNLRKISILVATPAYNCVVHIDYFQSMIALCRGCVQSNINVEFMTIGNNSLVPKARNTSISYFVQNKQFTHLFFLDADVGIARDCVPKLLKRNVDIIGVPVPLKGFDNGLPVLNIGQVYDIDKTGLAKVEHVGNAVLMISRKAAEDICQRSKVYEDDPKYHRGRSVCKKNYDVFQIGVLEDGKYLPEDYYFCHKMRKLGYNIYVDYTIPVVHNGSFGFGTSENLLNKIIERYESARKPVDES